MSVFISWSGEDRDVKNVIAARLKEENIPFFDSDEDCTSDFSTECIANIRRSTVFVVIISEASMNNSSYVINEVIEARRMENNGALNILVYKITDAPYTERFAFNLNHISDANHLGRVQKLGATGAIDTLIKRIRHLEKLRAEGRPEKPYDVILPIPHGIPIATRSYIGYFVEGSREDKLDEISSAFARSGTVILSEFFGYGKRSLIKRHAVAAGYSAAIELDAMGATLHDFIVDGLSFTNVNPAAFEGKDDKAIIEKKLEMLSRLNEKILLVITGVTLDGEPDELITALLGNLKCRIALITQSEAEDYDDCFPVLTLGRMTDGQLTELFYHYYDRGGFAKRDELTPLLHAFFEQINGHTKTVELAATVLSKEMHADTEAAKNYLTSRGSESDSLTERITERLAELIELESFTEAEKNVLLIISLMANPALGTDELKLILTEAGLDANDVNAVIRLKDKRWISYNRANRTVSIEPMIARLCISKFMGGYRIAEVCLKRLADLYESSHAQSPSVVYSIINKLERICALTSLSEAADVLHAFSAKKKGGRTDGVVNERFIGFFKSFMENYDAECERHSFIIKACAWLLYFIIPSTEIFSKLPTRQRNTDFAEAFSALGEDYLSLADNPDVVDASAFFNTYDDEARLNEILAGFSSLVLSADFEQMESFLGEIISMLDDSDILTDSESCNAITGIVKLFCVAAGAAGAYRAALSVLERLIAYDFPPYNEYQLLLAYSNLLLECDDPPQSPSEIMGMASDMLSDAAADGAIDTKTLALARGDMLLSYAAALASEEDFDGAIEKIDELDEIGQLGVSSDVITVLAEIAKELTFIGESERAVSLARRYEEFLRKAADDAELHEDYRENASSVLALLVSDDELLGSDFGRGGIVENQSYYDKYSQDKKNGIFKMSKYRRAADLAKRYDFSGFTNEDILSHADKLRQRAAAGEPKMNLAPEAFALVSEAGYRTLGYRHYHVQYVGAAAMLDGKIAEILNGEGKTYTVALVAFVNSLYSDKVFITDSSPYLTQRNAKWMRGLYSALGVRTYLVAPRDKYTNFLDSSDNGIYYADTNTLAVGMMLRNESKPSAKRDLRGFALIIDEADTVLVEYATAPFSLVNKTELVSPERTEACRIAWQIVSEVFGNERYYTTRRGRIIMSDELHSLIEKKFGLYYDDVSDAVLLSEKERVIRQAIRSISMKRNVDYFIKDGAVMFERERDGSLFGANAETAYFILKKENLDTSAVEEKLSRTVKTVDKIYVHAMICSFGTFSGTSATASSFKKEFRDLYDLEVISIPPAAPIRRTDRTVTFYTSAALKDADIVSMIGEKHEKLQPVLLIVRNTAESVRYSQLLSKACIPHKVLNAENSESSPEMLAQAGRRGSVLIATQLANRGVDIKLGGDPEMMTLYELIEAGVDVGRLNEMLYTIPSEDVLADEVYKKYASVLKINKLKTANERELVREAGGLTVISSEPYGNMRIEQQIRGRAGRQGEVGESYIFESIDDETCKELLPAQTITRIKNVIGENELISFNFLAKTIEKAKERLHHRTFSSMELGKRVSMRIEKSKERIIGYYADSYDGDKVRELIELWAADELIVSECKAILEGYEPRGGGVLAKLYKEDPDVFESCDGSGVHSLLMNIAHTLVKRMSIPDDSKYDLLLRELRGGALADHLTEMEQNDYNDSWNGVHHSERFYAEKYERNLNRAVSAAVDRWLLTPFTLQNTTVTRKTPVRPLRPAGSENRIGRNDPCPCGSGKKYKFCCGADKKDNA